MQIDSLLLIPKTVPKSTRLCSTFQSVVFGFAIRLEAVTGTVEVNSSLRARPALEVAMVSTIFSA
jgi:hypothetical protein